MYSMTKNYADTLTISQKAKFSRDFSKAYRGERHFIGLVEYLIEFVVFLFRLNLKLELKDTKSSLVPMLH